MVIKRILFTLLSIFTCLFSSPSHARECESIDDHARNTDAIYRKGCGAIDGAYTATSSSMLGWGIGLFIAIAILTGILHQSKGKRIATTS